MKKFFFNPLWLFLVTYKNWAGWVMVFVGLGPGSPKGSSGSVSGLNSSEDGDNLDTVHFVWLCHVLTDFKYATYLSKDSLL